jgi:hypothetical protein
MLLKGFFWYLLYLLKYIIVGGLISGVLAAFFPVAGAIVGLLFLIGMFPAAWKEFREKRIPKLKASTIRKQYMKLKHEFKGFDDALQLTRRGM